MRSLIVTACLLLLLAGLSTGTSVAQVGPSEMRAAFQGGFGLPRGSYQESCQDIRMDGDRLQARCQGPDRRYHDTALDVRQCRGGDIVNNNGNLDCDMSGRWGHWRDRDRDDDDDNWQGGAPRGDYRRTCQNVRMNGNRLEARCQTTNGRWRDSSLDLSNCNGDITNDDGHLRCSNTGSWGGPGGYWRGGTPRGAYRDSCQNIRMNGNRLEASCQKRDGGWRDTSIDASRCRGDITNDDGNLRCANTGGWGGPGGYWQGGMPRGAYRDSCQNIRMNGNRLEASCQKRDGQWRDTSIDASKCRGDISNDDGQLRCR